MAVIASYAKQTASTPERVARAIIHAALWRSESVLSEVSRLAIEEGRNAAVVQLEADTDDGED